MSAGRGRQCDVSLCPPFNADLDRPLLGGKADMARTYQYVR